MSDILHDTGLLLDALDVELRRGLFHLHKPPRRIVAWDRSGIRFATKLRLGSPSGLRLREPLTVITPHAHSAAMLLERIERAFDPLLGPHLSHDFFERIGEAVSEYGAVLPLEGDSCDNLLRVILREARDILADMKTGEFPYVPARES